MRNTSPIMGKGKRALAGNNNLHNSEDNYANMNGLGFGVEMANLAFFPLRCVLIEYLGKRQGWR